MSGLSTLGKVGAVIAFPFVFGGCCGGSLLAFGTISATLGAAGSWATGLGGVAVILTGVGALLFIRSLRRQKNCEFKQEAQLHE